MKEIKRKDLIKKLKKLGVEEVRQGKTSHAIFRLGNRTTVIPTSRIIPPGTLRDILKQLDLYKKVKL